MYHYCHMISLIRRNSSQTNRKPLFWDESPILSVCLRMTIYNFILMVTLGWPTSCVLNHFTITWYYNGMKFIPIKHYGRENLKEDLNKKLNHRMGEWAKYRLLLKICLICVAFLMQTHLFYFIRNNG